MRKSILLLVILFSLIFKVSADSDLQYSMTNYSLPIVGFVGTTCEIVPEEVVMLPFDFSDPVLYSTATKGLAVVKLSILAKLNKSIIITIKKTDFILDGGTATIPYTLNIQNILDSANSRTWNSITDTNTNITYYSKSDSNGFTVQDSVYMSIYIPKDQIDEIYSENSTIPDGTYKSTITIDATFE